MRPWLSSVTHWFFEKFKRPHSEGADGFLSSRSRLRCLFFEPLWRFARFGVHVGARAPPRGGRLTVRGDQSLAGPSFASPFEVLRRRPFQNLYSGRVGVSNFERNCSFGGRGSDFVRSFEKPTLPECRFWKGSQLKTSNEIASEGVTDAFSFDV